MKETDKRIEASRLKADRELTELKKMMGGMANSNGSFAEEYEDTLCVSYANVLKDKKMFAGLKFDDIELNMKGKVGNIRDEFDIVMYNGTFRALFPYYADYKIYLGIGSMSFNERVYAKELGIGVLLQKGDTVELDTSFARPY